MGGVLLALVAAAVFLFRDLLFGEGKDIVYRIPAHFSGWVVVKFSQPSCPSLKEDKNAIHVQVGMNGEACTSHPLFEGWKKAKYLKMNEDGTEKVLPYGSWDKSKDRIWSVTLGYVSYTKEGKTYSVPRELFFVGTKEQLEGAWNKQPSLE
jgi:hypothetical protein